eukprot:jgi/Tetstr1/436780/TSEL_025560.t1
MTVLMPCEVTRGCIFSDLSSMQEYGSRKLVVGPDEMYLTRLYADAWSPVHHKYACPEWKVAEFRSRTGEVPVLLHFVTDKPWGTRDWPDFHQWRAATGAVAAVHPSTEQFFSPAVRASAQFRSAIGGWCGWGQAGAVPAASQPGQGRYGSGGILRAARRPVSGII